MFKSSVKFIFCGSAALLMSAGIVFAGSGTYKHSSGAKVHIKCQNSGCYVRETSAAGKRGKRERVGDGGVANYKVWVARWKAKGYK